MAFRGHIGQGMHVPAVYWQHYKTRKVSGELYNRKRDQCLNNFPLTTSTSSCLNGIPSLLTALTFSAYSIFFSIPENLEPY